MKKIFFIFLIFILGCSQLEQSKQFLKLGGKEKLPSSIGKGGTILTTIESPLAGRAIPKGPFSPKIKVVNSGSTESLGSICLVGLSKEIFPGFSGCECQTFDFYAFEDESFQPQEVRLGPFSVASSGDAVFTAISRFNYETRALAKLCFIEDCSATILEKAEGPIKLTNFEENFISVNPTDAEITLSFTLEDPENGLISKTDVNSCSKSQEGKVASVFLEEIPLVGSVDCGDFTFEEGKAQASCELGRVSVTDASGNLLFEKDFATTAKILVSYAYETRNSVTFKT